MRAWAVVVSLACALMVGGVGNTSGVLSDQALDSVHGASTQGWMCVSVPCGQDSCAFNGAQCVQTYTDCHPDATCQHPGVDGICCSDVVHDCYEVRTHAAGDVDACAWDCGHPDDPDWSAWGGWQGDRHIHCRYSNCPPG
jgi:hypothetical protein